MGKRKAAVADESEKMKKIKKETDSPAPKNPATGGANGVEEGRKNKENYMLKKERQKAAMQRPKLFLTMENIGVGDKSLEQPADGKTETKPPQLYVRDLQYLLIFALRRGLNYNQPRWCSLLRPGKMSAAMLIVLKDVSIDDFQQNRDCFAFLEETFGQSLRVQLVNPRQYFSSFNFDMYAVPMSESQIKGFKKKHGSSSHRNGIQVVFPKPSNAPENIEKTVENSSDQGSEKATKHKSDQGDKEKEAEGVPKTELLLSVTQMMEERYPVPDAEDCGEKYAGYVNSKEKYAPVTSSSPLFAVDCEMCFTSAHMNELTRVSIVNEQNEVIYDELVKPYNTIYNYLTRYSGITKKLLDPVKNRIEDVQREISALLPDDAILCGQSLGNDLSALKMFHPYVIDTSVIYNLCGNRKMKCSLKRLAFCFLGRVIQESRGGHSSAEDAKATMDLVLLKLKSKTLAFGDAVLGGDIGQFLPSYPDTGDTGEVPGSAEDRSLIRKSPPTPGSVEDKSVTRKSPQTSGKAEDKSLTRKSPQTSPQKPGPHDVVMMRSLFDLVNEFDVSACQVGGKGLVSQYQEEQGVKCCQTDSDEKACRKAEEHCHDCKFTWVEFSAFADLLAAQETEQRDDAEEEVKEADLDVKKKKKALKSLDKHVKKLVEQLPEKCLVTVVFTGRSSQQLHQSAAAFLHIT